jgi:hypothetical protein
MKHIATMALMLNLGVAGLYAHEKPLKMTFSGTEGASAINLQYPDPHTGAINTSEFNFAGNGSLGSFTFRNVEAESDLRFPQQSSTCPANQAYSPTIAGAGVFRFKDGSLLNVKLTEGHDCIDFVAQEAHCTRIFEITGGTGRFKDASGKLTLTETATPVMADAAGFPALFVATGEFTGTVSGAVAEDEGQDHQQ